MNASARTRFALHRMTCSIVWLVSSLAGWCGRPLAHQSTFLTRICIEAGREGWNLIEYQEIGWSASEFFGAGGVVQHSVCDRKRYLQAAQTIIREVRPEFYWFDPRSGAQEPLRAIAQSVALAVILAWYGVTPIAWLANAPHRVWRLQAEVITVRRGVCLNFAHPKAGGVRFAHGRIHGPCFFPLSQATLHRLQAERAQKPKKLNPVVSFVGSLYEPRRSRLEALRDDLARRGVRLNLIAPELTGKRLTNDEYWAAMLESDILITTADHETSDVEDVVHEPHLVFRYTEALAAGAALVAPIVKGSEDQIRAGRDYLSFESIEEAAKRVLELQEDAQLRASVADQGHRTMERLVESGTFWRSAVRAATERNEMWLSAPFSGSDSKADFYG